MTDRPLDAARLSDDVLASMGVEVVGRREEPPRAGRTVPWPPDVPDVVVRAFGARGVERPYAHQRTAIDAVAAGRDVVLTSGTASGKSLAYQVPILAQCVRDSAATALVLHPTKALAYDQATSAAALADAVGLAPGAVATYDGDLPRHARPAVRASVRMLVTNPDMLHAGILPHHVSWRRWFEGLSFVVVDEVHAYRGVFGGHVAGVLRRLVRIAEHHGAQPRFVVTSATLGNPGEHASRIVGRRVTVVSSDDAARPGRAVRVVRPRLTSAALGIRRPAIAEATDVAERLAAQGAQVLVFARSRQGAEEAVLHLRSSTPGVRSYRSGLLPSERRAIEDDLRSGRARIVVATNALEVGIDVGGIDTVVLAGYPGSRAAFQQQIGRAGRRDRAGSAVLVLDSGPMDAFLARDPAYLWDGPAEQVATNPDHPMMVLGHLRCAAFERPLTPGERFGPLASDDLLAWADALRDEGELHARDGSVYWIGAVYPAESVSLRSVGGAAVALKVQGEERVLGTVDAPSAPWLVHPGAVYVHDGVPFEVRDLDMDRREAVLVPTDGAHATRAARDVVITPAGAPDVRSRRSVSTWLGDADVTETVTGFRRFRRATFETLSRHPLSLPPSVLRTRAVALVPGDAVVEALRADGAWTADPNDYGPSWPAARRAALARDRYACVHCGATGGGPGAVVRLHVHHVVPFRTFASARDANLLGNLATLCPTCHAAAERAVRVRSGLAAAAYVLRSLAPLHVSCDVRDVGVTADAAAPFVEGRAAVIVYETVPGGVGLADALAATAGRLLAAARDTVASCACDDGCPSCVGPAGEPGHAGKREARRLLEAMAR